MVGTMCGVLIADSFFFIVPWYDRLDLNVGFGLNEVKHERIMLLRMVDPKAIEFSARAALLRKHL
jgi:hypothetical protein